MFFLGLIGLARGQSHQHPTTPVTIIDGSKTPELIPDAIAYRNYFLAISLPPNPADADRKRQAAHLNKLAFDTEADKEQLAATLVTFRAQFDIIVAQYNGQAEKGG